MIESLDDQNAIQLLDTAVTYNDENLKTASLDRFWNILIENHEIKNYNYKMAIELNKEWQEIVSKNPQLLSIIGDGVREKLVAYPSKSFKICSNQFPIFSQKHDTLQKTD